MKCFNHVKKCLIKVSVLVICTSTIGYSANYDGMSFEELEGLVSSRQCRGSPGYSAQASMLSCDVSSGGAHIKNARDWIDAMDQASNALNQWEKTLNALSNGCNNLSLQVSVGNDCARTFGTLLTQNRSFWGGKEPKKIDFTALKGKIDFRESIAKHYAECDQIQPRRVEISSSHITVLLVATDPVFERSLRAAVMVAHEQLDDQLLNQLITESRQDIPTAREKIDYAKKAFQDALESTRRDVDSKKSSAAGLYRSFLQEDDQKTAQKQAREQALREQQLSQLQKKQGAADMLRRLSRR